MSLVSEIARGGRKLAYYGRGFAAYHLPDKWVREWDAAQFARLTQAQRQAARERAAYYLRLPAGAHLDESAHPVSIASFAYPRGKRQKFSTYFFDLHRPLRQFPPEARMHYLFGDVSHECERPTLVKSRPVAAGPTNNVVARLNSIRHMRFINDRTPWEAKLDMMVFRNVVKGQPWREQFIDRCASLAIADAGQVNPSADHPGRVKPRLSVEQMLRYKFVACIEGNDVATALKWVMSSNSLAVMPRPRMESWFQEGLLQPGVHYVEIAEDYSDLEYKLRYYMQHPEKAREILSNAHAWTMRYRDPLVERYTQHLVLSGYLRAMNPGLEI